MKETVDTTNNIVQPIPSGTNRPLWSVMIPTFNPGIYFIDAVNSAISQNIGPELMQIDIVDDCSTKVDIPKIIEENWKGRVGYHRLPKNVGHSFNFTESVRRAKGELVHLLHDDDLVKPGFYSKFENIFNKYENIGAAFCRQEYIDDDGKFMFYSELEMEEMGILDDALVKLAQKQRIQYCAMVIRRNAFEQIGGFVTKNIGCEDWEMWVRIASRFPIAYEPEALAQYRIHRKSMTLTDMRSGQDMRFLREAADIFTQYLPEEKRKEVTLFRNKHYAAYSLSNAKRMFEEFNDEEGAVAQLSETIKLNSEIVYENLDFLEKLTKPIEQAGVSVVVNCQNNKDLIDITLRSLSNQKVSKFIPWEIIFVVDSASDSCTKIALDSWAKYRSKTPLRILTLKNISQFESRKITIEDSKYNFVVFCNPGNLLNLDYIDNVSKKMMEDISTGAMGGYSEGQSSSMFPIWFDQRNNNSYQSGEQFEYPGDITWSKGYLWSAGLVIRKEAWITLMEKNFVSISNYESSADDYSVIDREICYVLRSSGWKIKYLFDLKLKNFIQPGELNWRHLRKSYFQRGKDSVNLIPYKKSANKNVKDFKELHKRVDYRRLVTITCRKLQSYKGWKLNSYSENLEGDKDILSIEYYAGKLNFLLDKYNSYNDKVRI
ncbi:MAG: glycosyltransferase, partial [Ignavibacteria bacterium]